MTTIVKSQVTSVLLLPTPLIGIILDYCHTAVAMSYRGDKLDSEPCIRGAREPFLMRMSDGTVACWGKPADRGPPPELKNVRALCATEKGGFATIVGEDKTVICWGNSECGGDCSAVASELKGVEGICGSAGAFAALKSDGTVTTWGDAGRLREENCTMAGSFSCSSSLLSAPLFSLSSLLSFPSLFSSLFSSLSLLSLLLSLFSSLSSPLSLLSLFSSLSSLSPLSPPLSSLSSSLLSLLLSLLSLLLSLSKLFGGPE